MNMSHQAEVRVYKIVYALLVLCGVIILTWTLRASGATVNKNFEQTQCNQGLLVAALTGVKNQHQLSFCSPEIKALLEKAP